MISDEEQRGNERAEYGKYIIKELSIFLTKEFYKVYSKDQSGQMLSDQFMKLNQ